MTGAASNLIYHPEQKQLGVWSRERSMKKVDAERLIRSLIHRWIETVWEPANPGIEPSSIRFMSWLAEHRPDALDFRTTTGDKHYFIDLWFDEETGQSWKR